MSLIITRIQYIYIYIKIQHVRYAAANVRYQKYTLECMIVHVRWETKQLSGVKSES